MNYLQNFEMKITIMATLPNLDLSDKKKGCRVRTKKFSKPVKPQIAEAVFDEHAIMTFILDLEFRRDSSLIKRVTMLRVKNPLLVVNKNILRLLLHGRTCSVLLIQQRKQKILEKKMGLFRIEPIGWKLLTKPILCRFICYL